MPIDLKVRGGDAVGPRVRLEVVPEEGAAALDHSSNLESGFLDAYTGPTGGDLKVVAQIELQKRHPFDEQLERPGLL